MANLADPGLDLESLPPVEELGSEDNSKTVSSIPGSDPLVMDNPIDVPSGGDVQPSFYWTWKLLSEGYSVDDLQQVRQLELTTVYDHLIRAAETDLKIEPDWLLNQIEIESLETFVTANKWCKHFPAPRDDSAGINDPTATFLLEVSVGLQQLTSVF